MFKYSFYSIILILFIVFGANKNASAHIQQIGWCFDCTTGDLTMWIEHNQGAFSTTASATMTWQLDVNGIITNYINMPATTSAVGVAGGDLPLCSDPITQFVTCGNPLTSNWMGYTFPGLPVGVPITMTAVSGGPSTTASGFPPFGCDMFPLATAVSCLILPIELLSFTGENNGSINEFNWKTATEINNDYFTIERSLDGITFEVVDTIDGAGNSNIENKYSLKDKNPYNGISYYRLKQTDFDGTTSYSKVIAVKNGLVKENELFVYPNPTHNFITINNYLKKSFLNSNLKIYDIQGRVVLDRLIDKDNTEYKIDIDNLKDGLYFIRIVSEETSFNDSFIKH